MENQEIIHFIQETFKDNRKPLIPLLRKHLEDNSISDKFLQEFSEKLEVLLNGCVGVSEDTKILLKRNKQKLSELGDIADYYYFILNPEIKEVPLKEGVKDWDFTDFLNSGGEIHYCRLWINWFLPVYYLETTYELYNPKKRFEQFGTIKLTNLQEIEIVNNIKKFLEEKNYKKLDLAFLQQKLKGISTDCSETKNASVFDCLFSDIFYPQQHKRKFLQTKTPDKHKKNLKFMITEYLDDDRKVIRKEGTFGGKNYNALTIIFDKNNEIIETIHRGFLNGKKGKTINIKHK